MLGTLIQILVYGMLVGWVGQIIGYMFLDAINFNSDISKWDVARWGSMVEMFHDARNFNSDISK